MTAPEPSVENLRIAMIGTRGVPARYGGFETCVEEVGWRLADKGHEVVVYCRRLSTSPDDAPATYRGMQLVHLPAVRRKSVETLSHTGLSVAHLLRHRTDVAVVFNSANAPFLPFVRAARVPVATHVDGLEWQRAKWGPAGQRYYQTAERLAVRWSDAVIADATGIQDYYRSKFSVDAELISYGAPVLGDIGSARLSELGLTANAYHLVVARFEPENHVEQIVEGYQRSRAEMPLIVVGSAPYADEYTRRIHAAADDRVQFIGAVWDQELLDQLYANAFTYLHGHSVGGTNPSLLRAIGAADRDHCVRRRLQSRGAGRRRSVLPAVPRTSPPGSRNRNGTAADTARRAHDVGLRASLYDWNNVADHYEALCRRLATARRPATRSR